MEQTDQEAVGDVIAAMRRESSLRTRQLLLIAGVLPCLMIATSFPFFLSDLVFSIGAPLTHVFHAGMLYAALFLVFFVISKALARRRVWASGKAPSVGSTVPRIVNEIAAKLGVSVEVQPFGGTRGGEMEAVEIDGRRIVRVGTSRLREAKSAPQDFRFVVAHELTHLAAGDPRTDRIVSCAYATAATFMLVSFCSVLWEIADGLAKSLR